MGGFWFLMIRIKLDKGDMMDHYIIGALEDKELGAMLIAALEQNTGKKVFTMRVLDDTEKGFEVLGVFEDKRGIKDISKNPF